MPLRVLQDQRPELLPSFVAFVREDGPGTALTERMLDSMVADRPLETFELLLAAWEGAWDGGDDPEAALEALMAEQAIESRRLLQRLASFAANVDEFAEVAALLQELQLRAALAAHRAQAREAARRPVAFGRLDALAVVSHELRTPLAGIMGYAELLEDTLAEDAASSPFVAKIQEAGQRLLRLVEDLLDVAKVQAGTFAVVPHEADLGALIQEIGAALAPQAAAVGVTLLCEVGPGPWTAHVDARRIWQVVANLVHNAFKFTPAGGQVRLRAQARAGCWRIGVADTGPGFPPEQAAHLFERFYQVDQRLSREHAGAGLGLSICKALVEAHGGRIGAASVMGHGSTFWFELPR